MNTIDIDALAAKVERMNQHMESLETFVGQLCVICDCEALPLEQAKVEIIACFRAALAAEAKLAKLAKLELAELHAAHAISAPTPTKAN